jgi:hypothetical protein
MSTLVKITDDVIQLSSSLKEANFGRTDLGNSIDEKGYVITVNDDLSIGCEEWAFTNTKIADDGIVYFEGKTPFSFTGTTLFNLLEQNDDAAKKAKKDSMLAITYLLKEEKAFGGAMGILYSEVDSKSRIIALPANLFERCARNSSEYGQNQGIFVNRALTGQKASLFTRSVIAYKALSGAYPFTETDLEKRQNDITDFNFIPLQYMVSGIDIELADSINAGLKTVNPVKERRTKKLKSEDRALIQIEQNLNRAKSFSVKAFVEQLQKNPPSPDAEFNRKRDEFTRKQKRRIKTKRFLARNKNRIIGTAAALVIAVNVIHSFNKTNGLLATSLGLTAEETARTFYTGIHKADVPLLQEIAKGSKMKNVINITAGFYVTNKQRVIMDEKEGTLSPVEFLRKKGETDYWQYGISGLTLDGTPYPAAFEYPRRNDKKAPLKTENGEKLIKGQTKQIQASYNLIHYDGANVIAVNKVTETLTLKWNGKRWIVRDVEGKSRNSLWKVKSYKADITGALEESGGDLVKACDILRLKYDFIPRADELQ